jgi:hypothetical protein
MVSAFKNAAPISFMMTTTALEILVGNGAGLSDFWTFGTGLCHEDGLSSCLHTREPSLRPSGGPAAW